MTCWGSRSGGTGEFGELPQPSHPSPHPRAGKFGKLPQPPEGPPGICLAPFQEPGFHYPLPTLILLGDLQARWRGSRRVVGWPPTPEPQPCEPPPSCPRFRHPLPQFYSRTQGSESPPIRGAQESQLQHLPRTKASESSVPRSQHPGPLSFCPVNQVSKFSPAEDPCPASAHFQLRAGTRVRPPPRPPSDAVSAPPEPLDPGEAELTDPGPILAPGVFLRLRLRQRERRTGRGRLREQVGQRDFGWREAGP